MLRTCDICSAPYMAYPSAPYVTYLIQCFIYSLPYTVPLRRLTESVTYKVLHMKHLTDHI